MKLIAAILVCAGTLSAQSHCPVVGDTVAITGQILIRKVGNLDRLDLVPIVFPNRSQPICILVKPYIGAGVGRVDRTVGGIAHIWLDISKRYDSGSGNAIPTETFLEITGKLIGQSMNSIADSTEEPPYEVTIEVASVKDIDNETNGAVQAWKNDCFDWIDTQLRPRATATWKEPPRPETRPKINEYKLRPFATFNGSAAPQCAASVRYNPASGGSIGGLNIARPPYVIDNLGGISFSGPLEQIQMAVRPGAAGARISVARGESESRQTIFMTQIKTFDFLGDGSMRDICLARASVGPHARIVPFQISTVSRDQPPDLGEGEVVKIAVETDFGTQLVTCGINPGTGKFGPLSTAPENARWHPVRPPRPDLGLAGKTCTDGVKNKLMDRPGLDNVVIKNGAVEIDIGALRFRPGVRFGGVMAERYDIAVAGIALFKSRSGPDLDALDFECLLSPRLEIKGLTFLAARQ